MVKGRPDSAKARTHEPNASPAAAGPRPAAKDKPRAKQPEKKLRKNDKHDKPGSPAQRARSPGKGRPGTAPRGGGKVTAERAARGTSSTKPATRTHSKPPGPPMKKESAGARRATVEVDPGPKRAARVTLIGRPNVGKSTLLNAALGQPLAIVSSTPQTTRDALLGVVHHGAAEIALLDTPGLHRPKTQLGRVMNEAAREAVRNADVVVFVTDVPEPAPPPRTAPGALPRPPRALTPHPGDRALLADLGTDAPTVLVVNKIDRLPDKGQLLPLLESLARLRAFASIVPISALREDGVQHVLDEVAKICPEGEWSYAPDELTDRPTRFFAAEYVREQILRSTQEEVPHATAVQVERFLEPSGEGVVHIDATIHVERPGQKKILIGAGAEKLKRIGTQARLRIEELVGRQVNLKLWVRVTPNWRESQQQLEELGYGKGETS